MSGWWRSVILGKEVQHGDKILKPEADAESDMILQTRMEEAKQAIFTMLGPSHLASLNQSTRVPSS